MMVAITAIAAAWFSVLSAYLFSARSYPHYRPEFAKNLFIKPLSVLSISIAFCGFYMAWVSDPVTLKAFELMGIANNGIADTKVQNASIILTILIGIPLAITYKQVNEIVFRINADIDIEKYFPWAGLLMIIVAAIFATSSAVLAIPNN